MTQPAEKIVELSIIIAASGDPQSPASLSSLERCLESLSDQADAGDTEIIVASNYNGGAELAIESRFPHVSYLRLPETATVPELRTQGIARASGRIIALLEDHCVVDEHWSAEIRKAHELPYAAVGGSVENASDARLLDWAVYFYDYGKYMQPNRAGATDTLPGNNLSYKRSALDEVKERFRTGFYETFVHEEMKKRGMALHLAPSAIVCHRKSYELRETLARFFHHARAYSGRRVVEVGVAKRMALALGSPALPVVLTARIVFRALRKRRCLKKLLTSLPHLMFLMSSWSLGEFCGYLWGESDSARHWK